VVKQFPGYVTLKLPSGSTVTVSVPYTEETIASEQCVVVF